MWGVKETTKIIWPIELCSVIGGIRVPYVHVEKELVNPCALGFVIERFSLRPTEHFIHTSVVIRPFVNELPLSKGNFFLLSNPLGDVLKLEALFRR